MREGVGVISSVQVSRMLLAAGAKCSSIDNGVRDHNGRIEANSVKHWQAAGYDEWQAAGYDVRIANMFPRRAYLEGL